jgi:CD2 antigen cytoplasmic tail-binding protein 2
VDGEEAAPDDEFDEKGVPIEPFNLRAEMAEGYFDKDGNYVRRRGGDGSPVRDAWLDEVDERLTNEGKSKALSNAKSDAKADDDAPVDLSRMRRTILRLLRPDVKGETSLTALRRLKQEGRMAEFNELTEAADACVQNGVYEIYSETIRQLYSALQADEAEQQVWEYRAPAGTTEEELRVHGPFTSSQMSEWHAAGYFQGDTVMLVRRKGSPTFRRSDELDFSRLLLPKETQGHAS